MKLIPAIMEKWPTSDRNSRKIFIQQDGAKNHICEDDKLFNNALEENRVNAVLYTQSAKPKKNTHPTDTRVRVGWGLWPLIVPIGIDVFFLLFSLFPPHLDDWVGVWVHSCVLHAVFGALVSVWNVFSPK